LWSVIPHRDAQRLLLPDEHNQFRPPRDPRIDQVPLQQHVVLRRDWDHHGWSITPGEAFTMERGLGQVLPLKKDMSVLANSAWLDMTNGRRRIAAER
jgi:hypothetical protein